MGRVRIGTCSGPADAALVRSVFDAHQIPVMINAEQHASMLAGFGGAIVPMHIFVGTERAEEAAALLADLREQDHDVSTDEDREADAEVDRELAAEAVGRISRRKRYGTLLMIVLAGAVATPYVIGYPVLSVLLVLGCLGAMVLTLRSGTRPELPRARIRR